MATSTPTGMVLAAQTYFQFHKIKMDTATLAVVSVSMCSELGPVLTALMAVTRGASDPPPPDLPARQAAVVRLLLAAGADVRPRDDDGATA